MPFSVTVSMLSGRIEIVDGLTDETRLIDIYRRLADRMGIDIKTVRLCMEEEAFAEQELSEALCDLGIGDETQLEFVCQEQPFKAFVNFEKQSDSWTKVGGIDCRRFEGDRVEACVIGRHSQKRGIVLSTPGHGLSVVFSLADVDVVERTFSLRLRHGIKGQDGFFGSSLLVGDPCIRIQLNGQILLDNETIHLHHPFSTRLDLPSPMLSTSDNTVKLDFVSGSHEYILSELSIEESSE